ncbi:MAG: hypothetical protein AAF960_01990 [Bacteroidota bacterium]
MSLLVYPYLRNFNDDSIMELDTIVGDNYSGLFGLENWRRRVWAAKSLVEMGCEILPSLRKGDVYAEGAELLQLERELKNVLRRLDDLVPLLKVDANSLYYRIQNALEAIRIARDYPNGGVYIG